MKFALLPWLIGNWYGLLRPPWAQMALTLIAALCGAILGGERERHEKPAGLRTLMLVSLGAAGFTMVSFVFTTSTGDSGRVAAQIVTGVGFLGAGVILHGRGTISGTTTAASIWVMASIGTMAGAGFGAAALGMCALARTVLSGIGLYEAHIAGARRMVFVELDFETDSGKTRVRLERILDGYPAGSLDATWSGLSEASARLTLRLHLPRRHLHEVLDDLVAVPLVSALRQGAEGQRLE